MAKQTRKKRQPQSNEKKYMTSVEMPMSLYRKICKYAKEYDGRSFSAQMRVLAQEYVQECESYEE